MITETNTSNQTVGFPGGPASELSILYNGTAAAADSLTSWLNAFPFTIDPGQTITQSETWNGIPESGTDFQSWHGLLPEPVPYAGGMPTGTFLVQYGPGVVPTRLTTTFRIAPPTQVNLVTSVTTDQTVYSPGQPVNMTFTETNEGTEPMPIIIGSPEFQVMQNGTVIWDTFWDSQNPLTQPSWSTLQPGQSYSQTTTWDGIPNQGSPGNPMGLFSVSDNFDPNADVATVQIFSPPTTPGQSPSGASASDVVATLSTNQGHYKFGESVHFSVILKDVSAKHIALKPNSNVAQVTVRWRDRPKSMNRRGSFVP